MLNPDQQITLASLELMRQGDFAQLRKTVNLTPDQLTMIEAQAKTYAAAQAKWEQDNGEKVKQLEQQIADAQAALATLSAEQEKLAADNHAALLALLTPEQRTSLAVTQLQQEVLGRMKTVKLTDDQVAKFTPLCQAAANELQQLPAANEQARQPIVDKLYQSLYDQVLTDAQRAEFPKK